MHTDVTAVLLAGGRSSRMGFDKGLVRVSGQPLLQLLADRLATITDDVLVSANNACEYRFLGLTIVPDVFPGCGPLAGLHAAMRHSRRTWVLTLACDLPRISTDTLKNLIRHTPGFEAVIPVTADGRLHPVCAVYGRACLPASERILEAGENRMIRLLEEPGLHIKRLTAAEGGFSDAEMLDLDSPKDLGEFTRLLGS